MLISDTPAEDAISDEADTWRKTFLRCSKHVPDDEVPRRVRALLCEYWKSRGERPLFACIPPEKDLLTFR
jgi:hypothetical protein